jgi:hypothetical protein
VPLFRKRKKDSPAQQAFPYAAISEYTAALKAQNNAQKEALQRAGLPICRRCARNAARLEYDCLHLCPRCYVEIAASNMIPSINNPDWPSLEAHADALEDARTRARKQVDCLLNGTC